MTKQLFNNHDALVRLAQDIDITASDYQRAQSSINGVTDCLINGHPEYFNRSDSPPNIYLQGSMKLGTVVRPIDDEDGYDVDLVCELTEAWSADGHNDVKKQAGDCLKNHGTYGPMLDQEGARCWTLNYKADSGLKLHVDVLPCVHERESAISAIKVDLHKNGGYTHLADYSISITNRDRVTSSYNWKFGNALGYAEWFQIRNQQAFEAISVDQKRLLLEANSDIFRSADEVPDALVRTPLQRAIQILKRHRDIRFRNRDDSKYKPISIIISTLAAKVYTGQSDLGDTLTAIIDRLSQHSGLLENKNLLNEGLSEEHIEITRNAEGWVIPNPVNRGENFADRWHKDNNARAKAFFEWIALLKQDFSRLLTEGLEPDRLYRKLHDPLVKYKTYPLTVPASPKKNPEAPVVSPSVGPKPWRL